MNIGIFSKMSVAGGSEMRVCEMANAIRHYTEHSVVILSETEISDKVKAKIDSSINYIENVFSTDIEIFYTLDSLLVINTDSKSYTHSDFWQGKTISHEKVVDLSKIKQLVFLFNFIISPSRHLHELESYCDDIRIVTTNSRFFNEMGQQDRYDLVRHFPRLRLESPIDPDSVNNYKSESHKLRIGMHSKRVEDKWNSQYPELIEKINKKYKDNVEWDFMGMSGELTAKLSKIDNVSIKKEFKIPVKDFLTDLDVFTFFPSWKREEPWSRSVAEALMSGCPVLATNKGGNLDQVIHGNNGYLCQSIDDYVSRIVYLIEHRKILEKMSKNAKMYSKDFSSEKIINKYIDFITN